MAKKVASERLTKWFLVLHFAAKSLSVSHSGLIILQAIDPVPENRYFFDNLKSVFAGAYSRNQTGRGPDLSQNC